MTDPLKQKNHAETLIKVTEEYTLRPKKNDRVDVCIAVLQYLLNNFRSLLWMNYEYPSRLVHCNGGFHIMFSFLTSSSLLGVDFQVGKIGLSFNFFTEYFDGWDTSQTDH